MSDMVALAARWQTWARVARPLGVQRFAAMRQHARGNYRYASRAIIVISSCLLVSWCPMERRTVAKQRPPGWGAACCTRQTQTRMPCHYAPLRHPKGSSSNHATTAQHYTLTHLMRTGPPSLNAIPNQRTAPRGEEGAACHKGRRYQTALPQRD